MKHRIDPKIDCVFKALLGSEENRNLLVHFLNAILASDLAAPITTVEILNPYNEREFLDDKLSVVGVKARDSRDEMYQIEIQLRGYRHLPARILYNWADIYSQQLQSGHDCHLLKPTYAIWLLGDNLIQTDSDYLHVYQFRDEQGRRLVDHGGVWLLELEKFSAQSIKNEQQRWLQFFKDGEQLDDATLPDWMTTPEMRQAMSTLRKFSEKERDYHAYQARQNFIREQNTMQWELEQVLQTMKEKDEALKEKDEALKEKDEALGTALMEREKALSEIERLKALLANSGADLH